jgi:hypothetical protein
MVQKCLILLAFVSYEAVRLWWRGGNCGCSEFQKNLLHLFDSDPRLQNSNCARSNGLGAEGSATDTKTDTSFATRE